MTATRAIREFPFASDPWAVVESWAAHNRYHLVERGHGSRLFRKHKGWISVPTMVSILAFSLVAAKRSILPILTNRFPSTCWAGMGR